MMMNRISRRRSGIAVLSAVGVVAGLCAAVQTALRAAPQREEPNPHWDEECCEVCHPRTSDGRLDTTRFHEPTARANCDRCHPAEALQQAMHHPYDIAPTARVPAPPAWPLTEGRLTCLTCHDALRQCDLELRERWRNPHFLRREAGASAVDFCLHCHREASYRTASPHDQLDDAGREREGVCLFCHGARPDPTRPDAEASATLRSDLENLCGNCHGLFPHPVGVWHLVEVPDDMLERMVACELMDQFVIPLPQLQKYTAGPRRLPRYLPVDPATHKATCVTCHNPHEKGVLPAGSPLARGAEGDTARNYRLRLTKDRLCTCCHRL